ncbi:helix-hairpin-helix domain-containing protein [Paludibacterium yongneupense]|uniref:helix-hairpin-helix domain-containing protein n=1 Tax=Paludibacterium yongneupense TaxID=400061 RepID=UPI002484CF86|nr:helix-hairpin-helix domain-containing protein [Paludibacterium yongneupense]
MRASVVPYMKRSALREAVSRFRTACPRLFGSVPHGSDRDASDSICRPKRCLARGCSTWAACDTRSSARRVATADRIASYKGRNSQECASLKKRLLRQWASNGAPFMNPSKVDRSRVRCLTDLPNVGKETAKGLRLLGYTKPEDIAGECPFDMYERLCEITGVRHDPCVIDVFVSVTEFLDGKPPRPWWEFTNSRKDRPRKAQ